MNEAIHGRFEFVVRVWRLIVASVKGNFTIHVVPAVQPLNLVPPSGPLPDETVGQPATGGVSASGGVPPVLFAVTGGSLPPGVSLDPHSGQLSGAPTAAGDAAFEITATDSAPVQ